MVLSGYERVKRHRQKRAGLRVGLLGRGQKARAAAELMASEGISRATAYRRLETFVSNLPVRVEPPLSGAAKAIRTRRARQAQRDAARIEIGADVEAQRQRDAAFAEATRRPNTKRTFSHRPEAGKGTSSGRVVRDAEWEEAIHAWADEFAGPRPKIEPGWRRQREQNGGTAKDQERIEREAEKRRLDSLWRQWRPRIRQWLHEGRPGLQEAYECGQHLFVEGFPAPPLLGSERSETRRIFAAILQGWQEARDRDEE
jgi:hypothetical protein